MASQYWRQNLRLHSPITSCGRRLSPSASLLSALYSAARQLRRDDLYRSWLRCIGLFSTQINEFNAIFESGERINDKLLYAIYAKLFAENDKLKGQIRRLLDCFVTDDKLSPLSDSDAIFDKIEATFRLSVNAYMRTQIERLSTQMPSGYEDRAILLRNLDSEDGKTNIGLINFCMNALEAGSGYVYGAYGQDVTMSFLRQQQAMFRTDPSANLTDSK